ncbi:hypothetical protein MPH_11465 [Macrophomina phaseolina MS6]|uniref:Uncharacterized protein n=1 Tax=Macrophomina phaseolina (strain MS6) TaxID=1126212 RepID=K2S424_MACPH|nr:hypothetical protein MPH_11465 [Macrophomina phaseolina MS6]
MINRPRSSGVPLNEGFKFGKAGKPQLDMTRQRGPKADPNKPEVISNKPCDKEVTLVLKATHEDDRLEDLSAVSRPTDQVPSEQEGARISPPTSLHQDQLLPQRSQHLYKKSMDSSDISSDGTDEGQRPKQRVPLPASANRGKYTHESPLPASDPSSWDHTFEPSGRRSAQSTPHNSTTTPVHLKPTTAATDMVSADPVPGRKNDVAGLLNTRPSCPIKDLPAPESGSPTQMPGSSGSHAVAPPGHKKIDGDSKQNQPQDNKALRQQVSRNTERLRSKHPAQGTQPRLDGLSKVSSRHGPSRVGKYEKAPKPQQGFINPNGVRASAEATQLSVQPERKIRSSEIFGLWHKLLVQEQQEEMSSRENAKFDAIHGELLRLRSAEEKQDAVLKAAQQAKSNVSTKLKQVQNVNRELKSKIEELERLRADGYSQMKDLRDEISRSAGLSLDLQKEVKALKAEKKRLITARERECREATEELNAIRERLKEKEVDVENEARVREIREREVHELSGRLSEERDNNANTKAHLAAATANYNEITGKINEWDVSLVRMMASILEALDGLRQSQPTKESMEDILRATLKTFPQTTSVADVEALLQSFTVAVQSSLENARNIEEATLKAAASFESQLFHRLQEEFKAWAPLRQEIAENQRRVAVLEERCSTLQAEKGALQEQLKVAQAGEANSHDVLGGLQKELFQIKTHLTSVDSARLRGLESDKAKVVRELETAQAKVREEEERTRLLNETERRLRQTITDLKVSKQIEDEKQRLRAHYSKLSRDFCQLQQAKHANELHVEKLKGLQASENAKSQSDQIDALRDQVRRKERELQNAQNSSPTMGAEVQALRQQLETARADQAIAEKLREDLAVAKDRLKAQELTISALNNRKESQALSEAASEQGPLQSDQHAKELRVSLETASTDAAKSVKEIQQQFKALQDKNKLSDEAHQRGQERIQEIQEQLVALDAERDELRQELEEADSRLAESDQEAAKQRSDAEETLRMREAQWAAECEDLGQLLQAAYARLEENEASHQLKCDEYEERLRNYHQALEKHRSKSHNGDTMQPSHGIGPSRRMISNSSGSSSSSVHASLPAANSAQRRPQRKLDRPTKSSHDSMIKPRFIKRQSERKAACSQEASPPASANSESQRQATPRSPGEAGFEEDLWASQELGRHETLTEQGVSLNSLQDESLQEIPEILEKCLSKPMLFSDFNQEQGLSQDEHSSSLLSSMITPDVDELGKDVSSLVQDDVPFVLDNPEASSPTQRLSDTVIAKQVQISVANPLSEDDRPISQANMSKRIDSTTGPRRNSLRMDPNDLAPDVAVFRTPYRPSQTPEDAYDHESSPEFMSEPSQKNLVVHGHNLPAQSSMGRDDSYHFSTPAGAVKRRAFYNNVKAPQKRARTKSTATPSVRPSPRVTRASAKAGPQSHISETQTHSQEQHGGLMRVSEAASIKPKSQSQAAAVHDSQLQPRSVPRVPVVSRMRSSVGSSSSATGSSPARNSRRRKASAMSGRFEEEINKR